MIRTLYTSGMGNGRCGQFSWGSAVFLLLAVLVIWAVCFERLRPIRTRLWTPCAPVARRVVKKRTYRRKVPVDEEGNSARLVAAPLRHMAARAGWSRRELLRFAANPPDELLETHLRVKGVVNEHVRKRLDDVDGQLLVRSIAVPSFFRPLDRGWTDGGMKAVGAGHDRLGANPAEVSQTMIRGKVFEKGADFKPVVDVVIGLDLLRIGLGLWLAEDHGVTV